MLQRLLRLPQLTLLEKSAYWPKIDTHDFHGSHSLRPRGFKESMRWSGSDWSDTTSSSRDTTSRSGSMQLTSGDDASRSRSMQLTSGDDGSTHRSFSGSMSVGGSSSSFSSSASYENLGQGVQSNGKHSNEGEVAKVRICSSSSVRAVFDTQVLTRMLLTGVREVGTTDAFHTQYPSSADCLPDIFRCSAVSILFGSRSVP